MSWRHLIPRSSAGLTLAASIVGGVLFVVALSPRAIGPGDILGGAFIGAVFGSIGYGANWLVNRGADSGALWWGLLRKQNRPPSRKDDGRQGPTGEGWR